MRLRLNEYSNIVHLHEECFCTGCADGPANSTRVGDWAYHMFNYAIDQPAAEAHCSNTDLFTQGDLATFKTIAKYVAINAWMKQQSTDYWGGTWTGY